LSFSFSRSRLIPAPKNFGQVVLVLYHFCPDAQLFRRSNSVNLRRKTKMNTPHNSRRTFSGSPRFLPGVARLLHCAQVAGRNSHISNHRSPSPITRFLIATQLLELSVSYRKQTIASHSNRYKVRLFRIPPAHLQSPNLTAGHRFALPGKKVSQQLCVLRALPHREEQNSQVRQAHHGECHGKNR